MLTDEQYLMRDGSKSSNFPSLLLLFEADLVVPPLAKAHVFTAGLKKNKFQSGGLEAASLVISRK